MFRSFYRIFAVFMVLSLALAACSTPTATPTAVVEPTMVPTTAPAEPTAVPQETSGLELPVVDPTALSGKIYAAGSSTVYPLAEAIAVDISMIDDTRRRLTIRTELAYISVS